MDGLVRALKIFCAVAGVVIVGGTVALVYLLAQRRAAAPAARNAAAGEVAAPVELPAGARATAASVEGGQLVLLLQLAGGAQAVLVADLATGRRLRLVALGTVAP